jgi:hypothetical protein
MPNNLLHELRHGQPICETPLKDPYNPTQFGRDERWIWDTGIRFCSWNHSRSGFVTGSSDGVVKSWDIFRATEDAHTADLVRLDSAIMTAAYSPDYSRLIVGEVNKAITVLDVGKTSDQEVEKFTELHPQQEREDASASAMDLDVGVQHKGFTSMDHQRRVEISQRGCTIPLCRELGNRAVDESTAANQALCKARIPANLRDVEAYVPPKGRAAAAYLAARPCRGCGASVSPQLASEGGADGAWCQRCRFGCFRCGRAVRVGFPYDVVECHDCGLAWSVGAAGYDLIHEYRMDVDMEARVRRKGEEGDSGWDGELAEHYHALWGSGQV